MASENRAKEKRLKPRVQHPGGGPKLTKQEFKDDANINTIMERYHRTGVLRGPGRISSRTPMFLELTGDSFHDMLIKVQRVQGDFAGMPARIRKRFANNPEQLMRFIQDPKNLAEAVELGLVDEENLSKEQVQQLNLVREADEKDLREFRRWQEERNNRANDDDTDPFEGEPDEKKPPKKGGKRTS